jgi:hypothetical protein
VVVDRLVGDERVFRCLYFDVRPLECTAKFHPDALCDIVVRQQPVGVIDFPLEVVDVSAIERCLEELFVERFGECPDARLLGPFASLASNELLIHLHEVVFVLQSADLAAADIDAFVRICGHLLCYRSPPVKAVRVG